MKMWTSNFHFFVSSNFQKYKTFINFILHNVFILKYEALRIQIKMKKLILKKS